MTVRHIVPMSFTGRATDDHLAHLWRGLADLLATVQDIAAATWGPDVTGNANGDHDALVCDFADCDAGERGPNHPAHPRFIECFMSEIPAERVRVRYLLPGAGHQPAFSA